ncbi:MAG: hypothetical protein JWM31_329 [Solirubrobacterales bacterium]|nr:hypothetical protein [Solirubrobacterales bacterium]
MVRVGVRRPLTWVLPSLALAGLLAFAAVLAVDAASGPSLLVPGGHRAYPRWLAGPFGALGVGRRLDAHGIDLLLLGMLAGWLVALAGARALPRRTVVVAVLAAHLVFLLAPPLLSADVFGYIGFARIGAVHHLDPYVYGTGWAPSDPVHPFLRWHNAHSAYGPLFTVLSYALVPLGVAGALWAFKAIACAASLATVALVWRLQERRGRDPRAAAILVGLNPLLLAYEVAGGHNDALATLLAVAGIASVLSGREGRGMAGLVLAGAIKLTGALAAPFALVASGNRRQALLGAVAAAGSVVAIAVLAFGRGAPGSFSSVLTAGSGAATFSVPEVVAGALGLPAAGSAVRLALLGGVLVCLAVFLRRARSGADWIAGAGWTTLALLCASTWLLPWYATWLTPLAALSSSRRLRLATVAFVAFVLCTRTGIIPGGPTPGTS